MSTFRCTNTACATREDDSLTTVMLKLEVYISVDDGSFVSAEVQQSVKDALADGDDIHCANCHMPVEKIE